MSKQYRQGDLLLEEVDAFPSNGKVNTNPVLAHGEVTGHSHMLVGDFNRVDIDDAVYFQMERDGKLVHDEHGEIPLDGGKRYRMTRQRQYDPLTSIPRQVLD